MYDSAEVPPIITALHCMRVAWEYGDQSPKEPWMATSCAHHWRVLQEALQGVMYRGAGSYTT